MGKRILTALVAGFVLTAMSVPAVSAAEPASAGCQSLNDPLFDGEYSGLPPTALDLAAGDRLTMMVGRPASFGEPMTVTLTIDGVVVDSAGFPGAVAYVIPTSGTYEVGFATDGNATWEVACNAPDCSVVIVSPNDLKADSKLHEVRLSGATVANDAAITYKITGVTQDEPTTGGWRQDLKTPDANGLGADRVSLRGERNPSLNGRVYRIAYRVSAEQGGTCTGVEIVRVSPNKATAVDDGDQASWNSFTGQLLAG
jgi:hypothetical protein